MEHYDVTVHDPASEGLSLVVTFLLVIFFPIGIIVFIFRTVSRLKSEHEDRVYTRAHAESVRTDTSLSQSKEIAAYHDLYKQGILSKAEFEAKKESILLKKKLDAKALKG